MNKIIEFGELLKRYSWEIVKSLHFKWNKILIHRKEFIHLVKVLYDLLQEKNKYHTNTVFYSLSSKGQELWFIRIRKKDKVYEVIVKSLQGNKKMKIFLNDKKIIQKQTNF